MPPPDLLRPSIVVALTTVIMSLLLGMLYAWTWAIARLWTGRALLPTNSPRVVPWAGGSVLAGLLAMFCTSVGVSTAYSAVTGRDSRTSHLDVMLISALINCALLVVVPLMLRRTARARAEDFGLAWNRLREDAQAGFLAFLLIAPIVYAVQVLAVQIWERNEHPLERMMLENFTGPVAILAIVSAVILAPAVEELLFRGLFQGWLTRILVVKPDGPEPLASDVDGGIDEEITTETPEEESRTPLFPRIPNAVRSAVPVLLTSSLFALVHMPQWPAPVAIFLLSLGLGTLYQRTGSLVASFVLHSAFNGFSTLTLILVALHPAPLDKEVAPLPPAAASGATPAPEVQAPRPLRVTLPLLR
jgi:membrane protease YdiL (CAAX protease family)